MTSRAGILTQGWFNDSRNYTCSDVFLAAGFNYAFLFIAIANVKYLVLSNKHTGILSRCVRRSFSWLDSDWVPAFMLKTIPSAIMETIGIIVYRNIHVYVPRFNTVYYNGQYVYCQARVQIPNGKLTKSLKE